MIWKNYSIFSGMVQEGREEFYQMVIIEKPPQRLNCGGLLSFGSQCDYGILLRGLAAGDQTADDGQDHT